jgi:hypothetical protein
MSVKDDLLSPEHVQSIIVVTFILTMLTLTFSFYNYTRTSRLLGGILQLEERAHESSAAARLAEIDALKLRIAALEEAEASQAAGLTAAPGR